MEYLTVVCVRVVSGDREENREEDREEDRESVILCPIWRRLGLYVVNATTSVKFPPYCPRFETSVLSEIYDF